MLTLEDGRIKAAEIQTQTVQKYITKLMPDLDVANIFWKKSILKKYCFYVGEFTPEIKQILETNNTMVSAYKLEVASLQVHLNKKLDELILQIKNV